MNLNDEEKKYFEEREVWWYGPTYDITFVFERDYSPQKISETLLQKVSLILWDGNIEDDIFCTILKIDEASPAIGFRHIYKYRPDQPFSTYCLVIYPKQFERFVGAEIWQDLETINKTRLKQLHEKLFGLVRIVAESNPIFCTTICDEVEGWVSEARNSLGVYISSRIAELLDIQTDPSLRVRHFDFIKL
jgi:hypothetical protein